MSDLSKSFDFIAIDFEIANNCMDSACSLGFVAVKNNEIVETKYFLIHPPTLDFDKENISIHGITPDDVSHAPRFHKVWSEINNYFSGNIVVAHNAFFDMSVLKDCLIEYDLEIPDFKYMCSIPISNIVCGNNGRSLDERSKYFGIDIGEHHNSLDDAIACAKIVIECIHSQNEKSLETYCNTHSHLSINNFVDLNPQKMFSRTDKKVHKFEKISISEISATTDNFNPEHPFYGKSVVLTGELTYMPRKNAMQAVVNVGGIIKSTVSRKTDYLVVGVQDKDLVGEDGMSTKEEKAYGLIKQGYDIHVLSELEFYKLLLNEKNKDGSYHE